MLSVCQHLYEIDSVGDQREARDWAIQRRAAELLTDGEECHPFEPLAAAMALESGKEHDLAESMFKVLALASQEQDAEAFQAKASLFTRGMISLLAAYWSAKALEQASKEIR